MFLKLYAKFCSLESKYNTKKPEPANPPATTGGAAAHFTLIKAPNGSSKRVHFQDGESLSDRIDELTETLYRTDMEGKPTKSHTNHTSQAPDVEEEEADSGPEEVAPVVTMVKAGPGQKVGSEAEEGDSPVEEDSRKGNLTKAPLPRDPMYRAKLKTKTRIDAIIAIRGDTSQPTALRETRLSPRSLLRERSLKILLMPMEVQKNPSWLWPQPCPKPMRKPSPLCDSPWRIKVPCMV